MAKKFRRFMAMAITAVTTASLLCTSAFAALDPTTATSDGTWTWDSVNNTLTLNNANIDGGLALPENSTIVITVDTDNTIAGGEEDGIASNGSVSIKGEGTLTVTGKNGINATSVTIEGIEVDITGDTYGIIASNDKGDAAVVLDNVTGTISGEARAAILTDCEATGYDSSCEINESDIVLEGKQSGGKHSDPQTYSGILVYSNTESVDCTIEITDSKVDASGHDTGMIVNAHAHSQDSTGDANIVIKDSEVVASTDTGVWAGIFLNNFGRNDEADCNLIIEDSYVTSLAPNDVAIMGTASQGECNVEITDSTVGISGNYAGIRVGTSGKESVTLDNSALIVVGETADNYSGEIHFMNSDKTATMTDSKIIKATEGSIEFDPAEPYYPIAQGSAVTESFSDGTVKNYTFKKQAGGVGGFNYEDDEVWGYDVDDTTTNPDTETTDPTVCPFDGPFNGNPDGSDDNNDETIDENETPLAGLPGEEIEDEDVPLAGAPSTGDASHTGLYVAAAAAASMLLTIFVKKSRKSEN
ncbi:MAG: hypothetical protein IJP37_01270 [Clostridia bacterium]|nr:hypothetical protein [Clostridia bacterium]